MRSPVRSVIIAAALLAAPATAQADVVPFVDCVRPGTPTLVYFGYTNTGAQQAIAFGDQNQIVPGLGYQGQPETFNTGTYGRVFRAGWNTVAFTSIRWELNGHEAVASAASPRCTAGSTHPASDLTPTSAALAAAVGAVGQTTTYHFEYGTGATPDTVLAESVAAPGPRRPVRQTITGLQPATTYRFRVVAENDDGETIGEQLTFTTPAEPTPPAPILLPGPERLVPVTPPPPTVAPDTTPPVLRNLELVPSGLRRGDAPKRARLLLRLSEDASVTLAVERQSTGRRANGRCAAPTPANRRAQRCTRSLRLGRTATIASTSGLNAVPLDRLTAAKLKTGRHRLTATATDAAGNRSTSVLATFTVR